MTICTYEKRPVRIQAVQWNGENVKELMDFLNWRNASHDDQSGFVIHTLEGNMQATVGDYIIKGLSGEYYPCKEDIFLASYIKVQ